MAAGEREKPRKRNLRGRKIQSSVLACVARLDSAQEAMAPKRGDDTASMDDGVATVDFG